MHTQESGKGMKKLRNNKIRKLLAFMVALALMVSCMPSAYTISASEAFGDGTEDIFTDGEFTSEPAAEESTPDVSSADQEKTEQAQQSTLTYENDSVKVTAEALEDGALPQNTALKADSVNENSSVSYDTVSQKLSAAATDKGSSLRGFFAYDVYFADGDGNRVEPNGRVRVTFEYKTPAAENPEVTPEAEPSEAPAENPDAEPTEAPTEDPDVVEEPAEDIESPEDVPAADENGETSLIEVLGDDTNLRISPSVEAEVLATVNAGTQLTLLDTVTAEDGATWYKVSWEGTEAYIRSDMAQVVDSSDEAEEVEDVQEEEIQPEITRYDYTSDEVNVKVTLTDPADLPDNAELSVTPVELSQEAEDQITEEAIKEKKAIEKIHAYDIKFLVDGEEVQPGASVKVSVSLNDEKKIKDADVYHVDENDNVENMDGSVAKNGDVEFETTHFSTYVIVQKGKDNIDVTVKYCDEGGNEIYAADVKTLNIADRLKLKELANWNVTRVKVETKSGNNYEKYASDDTDVEKSIELAEDATVTAYYKATEGTTTGDPTFFDYTVKVQTKNGRDSINNLNNYEDPSSDRKLTVGGSGINKEYSYNYDEYTHVWKDDQGQYPNSWTGFWGDDHKGYITVKGLLNKVKGPDVKFKYADPGFFKQEDLPVTDKSGNTVYLRKVYKDYKLNFRRTGDTYKLSTVQDGNGKRVANAGANFFPLDSVGYQANSNVEDGMESSNGGDKNHNYFFGLRYDIKFTLGDYIGNLKYKFTGDDDLWVVLDGNKVVIDLGGIHSAVTGEVDLWEKLLNGKDKADLTDADKKAEHTLTVLYMERGAVDSNCEMEFTLPNATISQVTKDPLGTLELQKVNSNKEQGLNGARFTLYGDHDCKNEIGNVESARVDNVDGKVIFRSLREGTYYLKETQAPDGYVKSTETWTVKVEKNDDNTEALVTLKDSSGKIVEDKKIVNQTQQEIIESSMVYNKTATVKNWDQRTYDINITAASKTTSSTVIERDSVADIMMVFDMSGSMNADGRLLDKGRFDTVKDSLDMTKIYYYNTEAKKPPVSGSNYKYYSNPMIYIDGKWQYYDGSDWKTPSNSDVTHWYSSSSSYGNVYTWNSRITALKEAAIAFIKDTAAKSKNSKIGITTFYGYKSNGRNYTRGNVIQQITTVGDSPSKMIKAVGKITADGGTSPQKGLEEASSQLESVKDDGLSKYIILFTDGAPSKESDTTETETSISTLKQKAKIFTVALSSGGVEVPGRSDKDNIEWMKELATDEQHAFNVSDASGLGSIFKTIQDTITNNIAITDATITDVIDPRFVIVNDNNNKIITNEDLAGEKTITLKNGGVVSLNENGYQVVTWNGQTIPNKAEGGQWSNTITVRAKDEYIGGNNVPTNVSPDSKITTGYGNAILPQPKVNVKSDLVVNNNETTIFYGDTVPTTKDVINALFNTSEPQGYVTQLDGTKKLVTYTKGADGETINSDEFELKWYEDEKCTKEILEEKMAQVKPEPESKTYYLKVTYKNKGLISGKGDGTLTAHNSQDEDDKKREYGVYTIHIIAGQIQITKELESTAKEAVTFNFDVKKGKDKIATATARIEAGQAKATITFALEKNADAQINTDMPALTKLARGEYTVSEVSNSSYTLKSATVGEATNCKSEVTNSKEIKFTIGTDTHSTEVLKNGNADTTNGQIGVAEFTNEISVANVELEKVDKADHGITIKGAKFALYEADGNWGKVSKNPVEGYERIVSGNNGKIEMKNLPVGNYLLYETEAATGYTCPTEPWRIIVGSGGTVTVQDSNGSAIASKSGSEPAIYQLENAKVYSLPESGGPGTYGFTISGVAILATALLLFINNKRREEEAKKS